MSEDRIESLLRMYMPVSSHELARRLAYAVEREALEAAAKVCEANLKATPHHCAAAIRALIQAA